MSNFKVGDRVRARWFNGTAIGKVTKILDRCIFMEREDGQRDRIVGTEICVHLKCVTKLPGLGDIGYVERIH